MDENRQWFKSRVGIDAVETPRSVSFCAHAICGDEFFLVPDARQDERFASNPLVTGEPHVRFYAGMPIADTSGHNLGVCVIDRTPRQLPEPSQVALRVLARQAGSLIQIRQQMGDLRAAAERQAAIEDRLREANRRLQEMVRTDALTGLGNRRLFEERLRHQWKLSQRLGLPLSLLMVDIDHFKLINDTAGHSAGDAVLRHIGTLLDKSIREADTCARVGGEEFAILLPATSLPRAVALGDDLRRKVAERPCGGHRITISLGAAASMAGGGVDSSVLVEGADAALYAAKAAGRNRVEAAAQP